MFTSPLYLHSVKKNEKPLKNKNEVKEIGANKGNFTLWWAAFPKNRF